MNKRLSILGIRGIPAAHGGFESFAQGLAPYLVEQGWDVTVYCQAEGSAPIEESSWQGVKLVTISVSQSGPLSTFIFDWKSIVHAANQGGLMLTLGYNTAIFCAWFRLKGITNVMNMDGIEWKRQKWNFVLKTWFYINEKLGSWFSNHLVADHPEIKNHLTRNVAADKITVIPYGADDISSAPTDALDVYDLVPGGYGIIIARPEPENSILEIVQAFSAKPRNKKLVVLGNYEDDHEYHQQVKSAASDDVLFVGAIYEIDVVGALRYHAAAYFHGHQVGGTNPSLVEAMGAGNAVVAHDNHFNKWVAGEGQFYFSDRHDCEQVLDKIMADESSLKAAANASHQRFKEKFTWLTILQQYENVLEKHL